MKPRSTLAFEMDLALRWASAKVTRAIGDRWGDSLDFWYVSEFPKSGGTWLAKMLGDYLSKPVARHYRLPVAMPAVLHNHWVSPPAGGRCVYLYRDGRDVLVSMYFYLLQNAQDNPEFRSRLMRSSYREVLGADLDRAEIRDRLPGFIRQQFRRPYGCKVSWSRHIDLWQDSRAPVVFVSYEDLLSDAFGQMARILEQFGQTVDAIRLAETVERESFARVTGRSPGSEDATSFVRKGISGDWKNYFTPEASQEFQDSAGDALIRLGYESSGRWAYGD